jgi:sec-independent protein translocase protein TatC
MSRADSRPDPDDYFADTRMSFGDHIEELRTHLIRAIVGFILGMCVAFIFGNWVQGFITAPVIDQLQRFYDHRVEVVLKKLEDGSDKELEQLNQWTEFESTIKLKHLKAALERAGFQPAPGKVPDDDGETMIPWPTYHRPLADAIKLQKAQWVIGRRPGLSTLSVTEAFMVWIKICAFTGLVISSPWVFWQIWAFVAAGLYPNEKKYVHKYLPMSLGLFLAGVLFCEFLVIPKAIGALLWFNEWLGLEPDMRLNEWLSFAILLPLIFGLSFQTPMVMLFLGKLGIMDADSFRAKRRIAWFAMAAFSALFAPADALSMILMLIPMVGLYELGIVMVGYSTKASEDEITPSDADELVEV